MDFVAVVDQVIALLRQRGRMAYRTLQRHFQLDDEAMEDLKNRDREKPHSSPLPHHLAYGSVPRRFGVVTCCGEDLIGLTPSDQRVDC